MSEQKYKITEFKNRFKSEGTLTLKTFEELYFGFKAKVKRTREKYTEYVNADKNTKLTIKDVGGFIGGETDGNKRINGIKIARQLLTLDIDTREPNVLEYLKRNIDFYCIVHTTHSHNKDENRYRIIAPLSVKVNADEYEALGRRIAYQIENTKTETWKGLFDETTFQANRLMFFPSVSADGEYICELLNLDMISDEQPIIDVKEILDQYLDKNDIYEWFKPEKTNSEQIGKNSLLNKNPLKAKGLVGAFNRTYSISQAISEFLTHAYKKERNGRYTYLNGDSHGGGMSLNNDTIFYSHHGTDPANLYYRSAFDLVRIHMFGNYDNQFTPEKEMEQNYLEKTDSFKTMIEFCRTLPEVVQHSDSNITLSRRLEREEQYVDEHFKDMLEDKETVEETSEDHQGDEDDHQEDGSTTTETTTKKETPTKKKKEKTKKDDKKWLVKLDGLKSKMAKLDIVFTNDKIIGNLFYFDTFRDNICFQRKPHWHKRFKEGLALADKDMAHIRVHLDKVFDIRGEKAIDDAIVVEADKIQKNKVIDWFESLTWDKEERLEFFFSKYFKVPMNPFTRVAFKHWLVGAVSRIYEAGAPMDLLLIIKGKQGIGKSLFFKRLATFDFKQGGDHLYSDTKIDFNKAKDSYEQLEGIWIYEWKELAGMNMSDQESIKAFVDKTEDKFRRSYGRRNVEIKRRVAFGGSTNDSSPLRDRTGNRRFLVMDSQLKQNECYIKDLTNFTQEYRDQLLAEAIHLYKNDYDIFEWSEQELEWWESSNTDNIAENDFLGRISSYMEMKRPRAWYSMSLDQMKYYMQKYDFVRNENCDVAYDDNDLEIADKLCIPELWQVALGQRDITINRYHRDLLYQAIETLEWEVDRSKQLRFGVFGHQRPIRHQDYEDELPF
jgi:putative DNA primase/helicase